MQLAARVVLLCLGGLVAASGVGCQQERRPGSPAAGSVPGHERADCRPDKTCDPGLLCLSDLCVRPPAGDCQAVADQLATFDLGNYAEPEARVPVVAKYKAACDAALISKDEAQCIDKARSRWAAAPCAPRLFPEASADPGSTADCAPIVAKLQATMAAQNTYLDQPSMKAWFERTMAVMRESCEQDRWPAALKQCMRSADGKAASDNCNTQMPPELQQKLQARMTQAMQDLQAVQPPVPPQ